MTSAAAPQPHGAGGESLRLGTRKSPLALAQSGMVARSLEAAHPGLRVALVAMTTQGDRLLGDLNSLGGKGLFTVELEAGLLDGRLDLAVHSLKDLPVRTADGLVIAAYPERADPRDVLVSEVATCVSDLPRGARVLTGSLRRQAQLRALRPDVEPVAVRGNVDTRLRKWRESGAAGVVLAAAGLVRLGLDGDAALRAAIHPLAPEEMLPAPGQGILAVQVRSGSEAEALCRVLDDVATAAAARAERAVVAAFGGDCTLPLAAWARPAGEGLVLRALIADPDGTEVVRAVAEGVYPDEVAARCVASLRAAGAERVLARLRVLQ